MSLGLCDGCLGHRAEGKQRLPEGAARGRRQRDCVQWATVKEPWLDRLTVKNNHNSEKIKPTKEKEG